MKLQKAGNYIENTSKSQKEALQRMKNTLNEYLSEQEVKAVETPRNGR
jgi:hypothetical protein